MGERSHKYRVARTPNRRRPKRRITDAKRRRVQSEPQEDDIYEGVFSVQGEGDEPFATLDPSPPQQARREETGG